MTVFRNHKRIAVRRLGPFYANGYRGTRYWFGEGVATCSFLEHVSRGTWVVRTYNDSAVRLIAGAFSPDTFELTQCHMNYFALGSRHRHHFDAVFSCYYVMRSLLGLFLELCLAALAVSFNVYDDLLGDFACPSAADIHQVLHRVQ